MDLLRNFTVMVRTVWFWNRRDIVQYRSGCDSADYSW